MKILAIALTLLGAVLLVLSHPNQSIVSHTLSLTARYVSYVCLLLGFALLLLYLPILIGLFIWCVSVIVMCSIFPLITVFKEQSTHDKK